MAARTIIGRFVRRLREETGLTQEQVASKTGISYQFLSGVENGRENFSIDVLDALAKALDVSFPRLVGLAYGRHEGPVAARANPGYFRRKVPLPPGLELCHVEAAINRTQELVACISANLVSCGGKPLPDYVQGNSFSGLVSNLLCDTMDEFSPYKHNSDQAYPDLIRPATEEGSKPVGLEVKSTIQIGKGGESHNGHSGWHLVACFQTEKATGFVRFVHVMVAMLNGHTDNQPDWVYVGSKVNVATGSRRTKAYNTNRTGTTKLRDGTVFLDRAAVDFRRWRQARSGAIPTYSIFRQV
jgi:transcriptional regulator with XRE-family HTH domain